MDKVFYNEGSAAKLGGTPEWFGCDDFDEDLIDAIDLKLKLKASVFVLCTL